MEIWTDDKEGTWTRCDPVAGASPAIVRVLVIQSGPDEDEQLLAAIRLTRRLAGGPVTVIAGSEHPSACWRKSVRQAGADRALLVPGPEGRRRQTGAPLDDAAEVSAGVCPELHARREQDGTLSVCGRHHDRMVLARHHLVRWCLAAKEECPHWRGVAA